MLLAIGIVIGLVLGLTGAGGSVFAVPLLVLLSGMPLNQATGISLGAVAASTLYGSLRNLGKNTILWIPTGIIAATGALTAPLGKWLSFHISEDLLLWGFATLAGLIAARMWVGAKQNPESASVVRAGNLSPVTNQGPLCRLNPSGHFEWRLRCLSGLAIGGLLTGLISGLLGVGGGFLIVPLLLFLSQVSMVQAVSSSLVIIALISGSGFISHLLMEPMTSTWDKLGWVAGGGLIGMLAGQWLSRWVAGARLQQFFAITLIAVALLTLPIQF